MKLAIILALCSAVVSTPCIYDASSKEPSPLVGGITAMFGNTVSALAPDVPMRGR
ncbi:hypothetical protein HT585_14105 [Ensifer sp. HO-A22]|uniref:Uncharacterized protein n=1 Tax=Ensifer oleiphilus TaxID=2742698 RepID=A0A7Y6Q6P1_9HYPH|nr:hypothetical protein [Ensifer oleiphilus]NVD39995.1 hypothetical protein [Ensifer oleiphilus]